MEAGLKIFLPEFPSEGCSRDIIYTYFYPYRSVEHRAF